MSANLGRQIRLEKIYSRARSRADLMRHVDDEFDDEFEFPLAAEPLDEESIASLAGLMGPEDGEATITFERIEEEVLHDG